MLLEMVPLLRLGFALYTFFMQLLHIFRNITQKGCVPFVGNVAIIILQRGNHEKSFKLVLDPRLMQYLFALQLDGYM